MDRMIKIGSIIVLVISGLWLIFEPGFEPLIVLLTGIVGLFQSSDSGLGVAKKPIPVGYKLVVFDLDGTLIRGDGFKYSWQRLWQHLNLPDSLRRKYYNEYVERRSITYSQWCDLCVSEFKKKGLTKSGIREAMAGLSTTANLEHAITSLKEQGFAIALVSGGISTFLEEMIPNFNDLFDYVFINELVFDENNNLEGVNPTKYDFEHKLDAIKLICKKEKIDISQVVFVGEGRNDEYVFSEFYKSGKGLAIAYPSTESSVEHTARARVEEDDLLQLLEVIPLEAGI